MKIYNILFLDTHNAARSILAEVLANSHISKKYKAYSAGSNPSIQINPFALEIAMDCLYPLEKLRNKSWNEFAKKDAPKMDFIINIHEDADNNYTPYWPGNPITANWSFADPMAAKGSEERIRKEFKIIKTELQRRLDILSAIPFEKLDQDSLNAIHSQKKDNLRLPITLNEIRNGLGFLP